MSVEQHSRERRSGTGHAADEDHGLHAVVAVRLLPGIDHYVL